MVTIHVRARFVTADERPVGGEGWRATLFDKDPVSDDRLAAVDVPASGAVSFMFDLSAASSADSPLEMSPDLYVVLERGGREVLRTPVSQDLPLLQKNKVTGHMDGTTVDLGRFIVSAVQP